jgi:hypothetical protein
MHKDDVAVLQNCITAAGDGDYVEVGVKRGGSLCFAGLVKKFLGHSGKLYGIERAASRKVEIDRNLSALGLEATVLYTLSDPWPLGKDIQPVVAFIDGFHNREWVTLDWKNLHPITSRFVLFHDYGGNSRDPGVAEAVDKVVRLTGGWKFMSTGRHMAVFERQ